MRRRGSRQTAPGRARRIASAAAIVIVLSASAALAWTAGTTNPGNSITAGTLGTPGTPSFTRNPSTGTTCNSITVSWTAATNADRYKVERKLQGTWSTLAASHTTNSYTDTPGTSYTHLTITYRITPLYSGSANWTGPTSQSSITCGIGDVDDLGVTAGTCGKPVLSWSAAVGATQYDVYRSINGAAYATFTGSTNVAATTFTDTGLPASGAATGQNVSYRVRSDDGVTNSTVDSNTAAIASYAPFRITAINITSNANGSVNQNETLDVTFSEAADTTTGGIGAQSIFPQRNGASKGFYFASGTAATASSSIASFTITNAPTGGNVAIAGNATWPSSTHWLWTRQLAAAVATSAPTFGAQSVGSSASRVKCSDGTTTLLASSTTPTGWF
jgi:hypothetical protein